MTGDKRRSLYEFEWQLLRVTLEFKTLEDFATSRERINAYLEKNNNRPRALYKVINLMAAVAMGLHSQACSTKPKELLLSVQAYRERLSVPYKLKENDEDWSTDNEERKAELRKQELPDLHRVKQSLTLRWIKHEKGPMKYRKTRPELEEYIHLLEEELIRRAHSTLTHTGADN